MNKILAIIPARGGSKGLPKKNIKQNKHPHVTLHRERWVGEIILIVCLRENKRMRKARYLEGSREHTNQSKNGEMQK